jgi:hypothetical protein
LNIKTYGIERTVFIMEMDCVLCEVRNKTVYTFRINLRPQVVDQVLKKLPQVAFSTGAADVQLYSIIISALNGQ